MSESAEPRKRLDPLRDTTRELWVYSGNQCAYQGCSESLLQGDGHWNCEVAHIYGVKETAARGKHDLTNEDLRASWNLLLLCPNHHRKVDDRSLEEEYPVEFVQKMKADHENRYREAMAGLERIVDTTAGVEPRYPSNLRAIEDFDDDMLQQSLPDVKRFVDAIAKQPVAFRDLIALILVHGAQRSELSSKHRPPIAVPAKEIAGKTSQSETEIADKARHLERAGLLDIFDDEDIWFFSLTDPVEREIGWDIFVDLQTLAKGDRRIIERAIIDLDFTVFES